MSNGSEYRSACVDRLVDGSLSPVKDLPSSDAAELTDTSVCDASVCDASSSTSSFHVSSSTSAAASSSSSSSKTDAGELSFFCPSVATFIRQLGTFDFSEFDNVFSFYQPRIAIRVFLCFLRATARSAKRVLAIVILSVCPSIRLGVTYRYRIKPR